MSSILISIGVILFVMACIAFLRAFNGIFVMSDGYSVRDGIIFAILFLLSSFMLIAGIAMKCVVKDANEELYAIVREYDKKLK